MIHRAAKSKSPEGVPTPTGQYLKQTTLSFIKQPAKFS
jgi:hypothetical protein